jgi:cytochrome b
VNRLLIWPVWLRLAHWTLVATVLGGWLSGFGLWGLLGWHEPMGWAALAVVGLRLVGGFLGRGHARWSGFVRGPRHTLHHLRLWRQGQAPRHLGHNPLGGWMIVALLGCVAALGLTGFMLDTDWFWGDAGLAHLHGALAWALMALVAGHLAGVAVMSWQHHENLVLAMLTGFKSVRDTEARRQEHP